jgi:hypothetical protein
MHPVGPDSQNFNLFLGREKRYNFFCKEEIRVCPAAKKFFGGDKNMKKALFVLAFLFLAGPLWAADVGFQITIGSPGFYLSLGNFFGYPEREVLVVHQRGIPDDDLPVVFFLSRQAHVAPEVIIKLRVVDRWSWSRICVYYRIPPAVFYIPVEQYGPPYGHAYGYYHRYPQRKDWDRIRLTDAVIVNQVNLIFISKYYNYPPDRVIRMREYGSSFGTIERKIYREREYQARGGVPPQEMRRPGAPPQMRGPVPPPKTSRPGASPTPQELQRRKEVPPQGVRPPQAKFQDVYPSVPYPAQRPDVKSRYSTEEKVQEHGQGKKDKKGKN